MSDFTRTSDETTASDRFERRDMIRQPKKPWPVVHLDEFTNVQIQWQPWQQCRRSHGHWLQLQSLCENSEDSSCSSTLHSPIEPSSVGDHSLMTFRSLARSYETKRCFAETDRIFGYLHDHASIYFRLSRVESRFQLEISNIAIESLKNAIYGEAYFRVLNQDQCCDDSSQ